MTENDFTTLAIRWLGTAMVVIFGVALAAMLVTDVAGQFGRYPAVGAAVVAGVVLLSFADWRLD